MSRADSIALPAWALNQEAHALVEQIIAERPESFLRPYEGSRINGETVFKGSTAGRLRVMHSDWLDRELAALDHQFEVTGHWDDDASKALFATEDGNQLVERVLREAAPGAALDLTVELLGDDVYRVAA
jgi:hypothetical protein